jgi:hypothetical protein
MYFCMIRDLPTSVYLINLSMSLMESVTVIPFPLLEFSPGLHIHIFYDWLGLVWKRVFIFTYSGSFIPPVMRKVRGSTLSRSFPSYSYNYRMFMNRDFLCPNSNALLRWLYIIRPLGFWTYDRSSCTSSSSTPTD